MSISAMRNIELAPKAFGERREQHHNGARPQSEWLRRGRLPFGWEREERAAAPPPRLARRILRGERRKLVVDRAGEPRSSRRARE